MRLASFAIHWIKAEIHEYILRNWRMVKIATTKAQRKLFFNLRSMKKSTTALTPTEITQVAQTLNVKESDVIEREQRLQGGDVALEPSPDDGEEAMVTPIAYLTDASEGPAERVGLVAQATAHDTHVVDDPVGVLQRSVGQPGHVGEHRPEPGDAHLQTGLLGELPDDRVARVFALVDPASGQVQAGVVPDADASRVYAEPYETADGATVIPVAKVRGRNKPGTADAAFRLTAKPIGLFVVKDGEAIKVTMEA